MRTIDVHYLTFLSRRLLMNTKWLIVLGVVIAASGAWFIRGYHTQPHGFITLPPPNNPYPNEVVIMAPDNCPLPAARYAAQLDELLTARHILVRRVSLMPFNIQDPDEDQRLQKTLQEAPMPQVFINGRMMGSPGLVDILREMEYQNMLSDKKP